MHNRDKEAQGPTDIFFSDHDSDPCRRQPPHAIGRGRRVRRVGDLQVEQAEGARPRHGAGRHPLQGRRQVGRGQREPRRAHGECES